MKVLLITDNSDGGYAAGDWVTTLKREGMPYDEVTTNPASLGSVALPTLSSTAADGTQVANYEGVIVATSGTEGLSPAQWTTLQTFEHQFSVRQVTAYAVPSSDTGTTYLGKTFSSAAVTATNDAVPTPTLTADAATVFPYLKKLTFDPGTFGYEGTAGASDDTLVSGPNNSSLVGIYTAADGRQTLYQTFNENQYMVQSELLRHGELAWLARSTYFGDQRNYLETHIDDNFLADDVWSVAGNATTSPHSTDFVAGDAIREVPADVATAATWSKSNNFRMDMLFNGGGSVQFADGCTEASGGDGGSGGTSTDCTGAASGTDPLLAAFQGNDPTTSKPYTGDFHWINHTWDHPNLDEGCATTNYIEAEINQNTAWGSTAAKSGNPATGGLGLTQSTSTVLGAENPGAVVTGEHSGLANLIPGNPGQVDPPALDTATPAATGGTLAPGTTGYYVYAVADQFNTAAPGAAPTPGNGESAASVSAPVGPITGTTSSVALNWGAVCKAADYIVYRAEYTPPPVGSPAGTAGQIGTYQAIGVVGANTTSATTAGDFPNPTTTTNIGNEPNPKTFTDTGITTSPTLPAGASPTPLTDGTAVEGPYEQNPNLDAAFAGTSSGGIKYFGTDASKPYPTPADQSFATQAAGTTYAGTAATAPSTFSDAGGSAIPRYPTNIYYNVSTNAEEVDEYTTLYDSPTCTPIPNVTTCNPAGTVFTIGDIVASVDQGMFQHMMGNDPRPHYFHQSNLMSAQTASDPTGDGDGLYYETMNPLLQEYNGYFQSNAPIEQLTMAQIGDLLNDQSNWAAGQSHVTGSINGKVVTINNTGAAVQLPLTGMSDVGTPYAGTVSGWTNAPSGTSTHTAITAWPALPTTTVVVTPPTGPAPGGTKKSTLPGPVKPPVTPPGPVVTKKHVVAKPIAYAAVQVKPKTVSIKHHKVTVSLACKATKGKTAKNKLCAGSFTLTIAGRKLTHRFRFRSPKTHRFTVTLSTKVMAAATRTRRHHRHKMVGSLLIKTTQSHAKARQSRGTLTIRV